MAIESGMNTPGAGNKNENVTNTEPKKLETQPPMSVNAEHAADTIYELVKEYSDLDRRTIAASIKEGDVFRVIVKGLLVAEDRAISISWLKAVRRIFTRE